MKRSIRILLVDDYAPIRHFLRTTLQQNPKFEIVGEAADGLEAIEKIQRLRPDVVLLDIGLLKLNGIEVVRRIPDLSPRSKILIVSEDSSPGTVRGALKAGALGYLAKSDAAWELYPAVESVFQGTQYLSTTSGSHDLIDAAEEHAPHRKAESACHHNAGLYSDDRWLLQDAARLIGNALKTGNSAIVVATEWHRSRLLPRLSAYGLDVDAEAEQGRYVALDAADTLSKFVFNGRVDRVRFMSAFTTLIVRGVRAAKKRYPHVALFGECAQLLLARGDADAAMHVERLGNELLEMHDVDILCGYSLNGLHEMMDGLIYQQVCAVHSVVHSR